jgi:phosphonate transport system substrate-binding protein
MGMTVLVRAIRRRAATYRGAIVARADANITLQQLKGRKAVWVDPDSVGGYLLAVAYLRGQGIDPDRTFVSQKFAGSYREAVSAVLNREADLTSVFAESASTQGTQTGIENIVGGREQDLTVLAFTEESPNDGVATGVMIVPPLLQGLSKAFLTMHESTEGRILLGEAFNAERFELAPRMGYRSLYRVAVSGL